MKFLLGWQYLNEDVREYGICHEHIYKTSLLVRGNGKHPRTFLAHLRKLRKRGQCDWTYKEGEVLGKGEPGNIVPSLIGTLMGLYFE